MKTLLIVCTLLMLLAVPAFANGEATVTEKPSHEFMGLTMHPHGGFTLARVTEEWSGGFLMGLEVDTGSNFYVAMSYELHDVLTRPSREVYPWDATFKLTLGGYF